MISCNYNIRIFFLIALLTMSEYSIARFGFEITFDGEEKIGIHLGRSLKIGSHALIAGLRVDIPSLEKLEYSKINLHFQPVFKNDENYIHNIETTIMSNVLQAISNKTCNQLFPDEKNILLQKLHVTEKIINKLNYYFNNLFDELDEENKQNIRDKMPILIQQKSYYKKQLKALG